MHDVVGGYGSISYALDGKQTVNYEPKEITGRLWRSKDDGLVAKAVGATAVFTGPETIVAGIVMQTPDLSVPDGWPSSTEPVALDDLLSSWVRLTPEEEEALAQATRERSEAATAASEQSGRISPWRVF